MISPIIILATTLELLTLDQAVELAKVNHPTLRISSAQLDAASVRAEGSRAGLYPQVDASARYSVSMGDEGDQFFSFGSGHSYSAGLGASMLLYDFNRTKDRYRIAKIGVEVQAHAREATTADIMLAVEVAYFTACAQKELVAVARETLTNEERHLEQVGAFVEIGSRPEIDIARVRTALANARASLIRAESNYEIAKARLNQTMGIEAPTSYDVVGQPRPAVSGEDSPTGDLVATAIKSRAEFAELAAEIRAQELSLSETRRGLYPSLRVSADASYGGNSFANPGWGAGFGISLSWPIFDGWANKHEVRAEELGLVVLDAQQQSLHQRIWLEIEEARLSVRSSKATKIAADQALESARELLGLAEGRYDAGVGDIIELGDAQVAVTQAAAQAVQTSYDLANARSRLARALGS